MFFLPTFGIRLGFRVGKARVSVGRRGVRVGSGIQRGRARAGVSLSQRGGLGYGASYGTDSVRIGTNGSRISVGVTGKTGPVSYGAGLSTGRPSRATTSAGQARARAAGMTVPGDHPTPTATRRTDSLPAAPNFGLSDTEMAELVKEANRQLDAEEAARNFVKPFSLGAWV